MRSLFFLCYNLLVTLAFPVVWVIAFFNKKLRGNLAGQGEQKKVLQRFQARVAKDPRPIVWLHAASAGEFEQIVPLLNRFRQENVYIFQTFTSATIYYKAFTDKRFDGVAYLPWDLPWRVRKFVRRLQPSIFINTRHDLWPNLLRTVQRAGIRSVLVNANLYQDSARLKPLFRSINRHILGSISKIYTVSDRVAELLRDLYPGEIEVQGDTRFDQVHERAQANHDELIPPKVIDGRPVVVHGSVIESDLKLVPRSIAASLEQQAALHILVPHEVGERHLIPWEVECYRHKLKSIRMTELKDYQSEPVIIWNSVGQLADLYKQASLAYVGAGFGAGVHSVTEPAIYHVPAAHGPKYDILAEAIELVDLEISQVVRDADELGRWLIDSQSTQVLEAKRKALAAYISTRVGATDRIFEQELKEVLRNSIED
jgi:3-deoxy-D-manno-octulosonic-acid transferase